MRILVVARDIKTARQFFKDNHIDIVDHETLVSGTQLAYQVIGTSYDRALALLEPFDEVYVHEEITVEEAEKLHRLRKTWPSDPIFQWRRV